MLVSSNYISKVISQVTSQGHCAFTADISFYFDNLATIYGIIIQTTSKNIGRDIDATTYEFKYY